MAPPFDAQLKLFFADLRRFWDQCGPPVLQSVGKSGTPGLSPQTISDILTGKRSTPPQESQLLAILGACQRSRERAKVVPRGRPSEEFWREVEQDWLERLSALVDAMPPSSRPQKPNPWGVLAENHAVWDHTVATEEFRLTVTKIAGRLFDRWRAAGARLDDPWLDQTFAERMARQLNQLIKLISRNPEPMSFSQVEAALLVLTPLVHEVWSAESAVDLLDVGPVDLKPRDGAGVTDSPRRDYEQFLNGPEQRRLVSRTELEHLPGRDGAKEAIGWWLFNQWLRSLPQAPAGHAALTEDGGLQPALVGTMKKFARLFRLTPDELRDAESRRDLDADAQHLEIGGDDPEQVDEERIGLLLVVARELAVDVMRLPMTLVEHFGIPHSVDWPQLRRTLDQARWTTIERAGAIGLVAKCHHEAVLESLRAQVDRTTAVLGAVRAIADKAANLSELRRLPLAASADFVVPAPDDDGEPSFVVPVTRFRLDETRVRELLMGEQLYGDKSLAIRELYQNALDACRWRQARHRSRGELEHTAGAWLGGQIRFFQGEEEGRHVLRCVDNGIGMGESDLREVFSRAGVKFAERREFREEKAKWRAQGVPVFPNSRFGIGVLSYFMLADEIEVKTRRMSPDGGKVGPSLRVMIAGPGHLFRIEPLKEDLPVGTSVTLYLRDGGAAPSCVETLQRLLGIAEFDTHAEHDGFRDVWRRSEFEVRSRRSRTQQGIDVSGDVVLGRRTDDGQVVWCEKGGGLLVDGIHVGLPDEPRTPGGKPITGIKGAMVNLTGQESPQLTVDRTSVMEDVTRQVSALMIGAIPELLKARPPFVTFEWLCDVAEATPAVADALTLAAGKAGLRLEAELSEVDMQTAGCFPDDVTLVGKLFPLTSRYHLNVRGAPHVDDHLLLWRLLAHGGDSMLQGLVPDGRKVLPSLPTDRLITDLPLKPGAAEDPSEPDWIPPGHVVDMTLVVDADPADVVRRLGVLGYDVNELGLFPDLRSHHSTTDVTLLSRDLDGAGPWLDRDTPVPLGHVIAAHRATGMPVTEIARRLSEYSFDLRHVPGDLPPLTYQDQFLVSAMVNGEPPWLDHEHRVGLGHVFFAAFKFRAEVSAVIQRLTALDFEVTPAKRSPDWIAEIPAETAEVLLDEPVIRATGAVSRAWTVEIAARWGISPHEAARRLKDLGLTPPTGDELPIHLGERDVLLLTDLGRTAGDEGALTVSPHHLFEAAEKAACAPAVAAERLSALGFEVAAVPTRVLDDVDRWLVKNFVPREGSRRTARMFMTMVEGAREFEKPLPDIAERLRDFGYEVPDVGHLLEPVSGLDFHLLRQGGGRIGELSAGGPVPLAWVIRAAQDAGWSAPVVRDRLLELGFSVLPAEPPKEWFDALSVELVNDLNLSEAVSVNVVLKAALAHDLTIGEVVGRLIDLGLEVPDMATELPKLLSRVPFAPETGKAGLAGDR